MNKKIMIIISISLIVLVSVFFIIKYVQDEAQLVNETIYPKIVEIDESADSIEEGSNMADFSWQDLDGNLNSLEDYKGKPIVLNFWATWCPPCQMEMPDIESYYKENKEDVVIMAVNLTESEKSVESIEEFIKDNGYTFPVFLDEKGLVAQKYLVRSIPTTYFIDEEGVIEKIHIGPLTKEQIEEYINTP